MQRAPYFGTRVELKAAQVKKTAKPKKAVADPDKFVDNVIDADYWGYPVGTPIIAPMKPKGPKAIEAGLYEPSMEDINAEPTPLTSDFAYKMRDLLVNGDYSLFLHGEWSDIASIEVVQVGVDEDGDPIEQMLIRYDHPEYGRQAMPLIDPGDLVGMVRKDPAAHTYAPTLAPSTGGTVIATGHQLLNAAGWFQTHPHSFSAMPSTWVPNPEPGLFGMQITKIAKHGDGKLRLHFPSGHTHTMALDDKVQLREMPTSELLYQQKHLMAGGHYGEKVHPSQWQKIKDNIHFVTDKGIGNYASYEDSPEVQSIAEYGGSGSGDINGYLRGKKSHASSASAIAHIKNIDKAMLRSRVHKRMQMWRGVGGDALEHLLGKPLNGPLDGAVLQENGYMSCSANRATSENWGDVFLRISVPEGTRAVVLATGEREILLQRGLKFRVTKDHGTAGGKTRVLDLEVIPADPPLFHLMHQVGAQGGSNEGGVFEDKQGQRWYIKVQKDHDHAANEALASELYRLAGIDVPEVYIGSGTTGLTPGVHTATRMLPEPKRDLVERMNAPLVANPKAKKKTPAKKAAVAAKGVPSKIFPGGLFRHPAETDFTVLPKGARGKSGDGYAATGEWGTYGAGGALVFQRQGHKLRYLMVQRGPGVSSNKGKWQLGGGARDENETMYQGIARELSEELKLGKNVLNSLTPIGDHVFTSPSGWEYHTVAAEVPQGTHVDWTVDGTETSEARWMSRESIQKRVDSGDIHPALAKNIMQMIAEVEKVKATQKSKPASTVPAVELPEPAMVGNDYLRKIHEGFAADAWLASWDVAGAVHDNIVTSEGKPWRIDVGGSLKYRAQGAPKGAAFGSSVGEWDSLRDSSSTAAKMFESMTLADMRASVARIEAIPERRIYAAVLRNGMDASLAKQLIDRRTDLIARLKAEIAKATAEVKTALLLTPRHQLQVEYKAVIR